ncbi:MAG: Nramp family divalent metal transporter [Candidatus Thermoplasmatota archaeon]
MSKKNHLISFPKPYDILTEKPSIKKYLKYLKFFGPGAVVASLTIGQGQLILGPQIGAWAGFALLWLITINVGSYIIGYIGCRFTMLSGIGVMDLFAFKTRKGWLNWLFIIIMIIFIPIFTASIMTTLGQALAWVFDFGNYLIWGVAFCLLAGVLVLSGRYRLLEYTQVFFVAALGIGAIVSVIYFQPDLLEMLPNFFKIGIVPDSYPGWVSGFPSVYDTPIPLLLLGYVGTLTFTIITLVGYLGWIKVKKWGIFKDRNNPEDFSIKLLNSFKKEGRISYLSSDKNEVNKSKMLLKPLVIDLILAFVIVSIVSSAYMIGGATLLRAEQVLPKDANLVQEQALIFTFLADWLKPLFQVSMVFALFGTVYAGFEAGARMLYETAKGINKEITDIKYRKFMFYLLVYLLVAGVPIAYLMYSGLSVILMLTLTLMFIGYIGVIMYGVGVLYLSQKVLPEKYRFGKIGLFLSILGIVVLMTPLLAFL